MIEHDCRWCGKVFTGSPTAFWFCSRKCASESDAHKANQPPPRVLTPEEEAEAARSRAKSVAEWEVRKAEEKRAWFWSTLIFSIVLVIWIGIRKLLGYW